MGALLLGLCGPSSGAVILWRWANGPSRLPEVMVFFFFPQTIRTSLYLRFRNQEEGMGSSVTSPCEMVLHVKWV